RRSACPSSGPHGKPPPGMPRIAFVAPVKGSLTGASTFASRTFLPSSPPMPSVGARSAAVATNPTAMTSVFRISPPHSCCRPFYEKPLSPDPKPTMKESRRGRGLAAACAEPVARAGGGDGSPGGGRRDRLGGRAARRLDTRARSEARRRAALVVAFPGQPGVDRDHAGDALRKPGQKLRVGLRLDPAGERDHTVLDAALDAFGGDPDRPADALL